ncbi:MAG TPA: hydroxymethylglutaryl-CoA lyase [Steroidobacteraceae bacterium]|nr:hydroxymethylglutaryl-CoA lyase [Steroidobacteraceae bacterium]
MEKVAICEVGARDGLQNQPRTVTPAVRAELVRRLAAANLRNIEAGAFVSRRRVPQLDGSDAVLKLIGPLPGVRLPVLLANQRGLESALAAGARDVTIFTGATDGFVRSNIGCTVAESLARFAPLAAQARGHGLPVRGYVSVCFGCPFEGEVAPARVLAVTRALLDMGCWEVSLGDTIGVATPAKVREVLEALLQECPAHVLAGHYHDTYGMAVANVVESLALGLRSFDSSVGGLGGCPFAPGAAGNVATEELLYLLRGLGFDTGVDLDAVCAAGEYIDGQLGHESVSRVRQALRARRS